MDPSSSSAARVSLAGPRPGRLCIDSAGDVAYVARAVAVGAVAASAFANFYAIVGRPAAETVRRINVIKGRPVDVELGPYAQQRLRVRDYGTAVAR